MLAKGLVQIYTGNGKGKTTAALGLTLRAAGHGLTVYWVQFMKGWPHYGEMGPLGLLPQVTLRRFGRPEFVDPEQPQPEDVQWAHQGLEHAREVISNGQVDMLVLDEITVALRFGLIDLTDVLELLDLRPETMEIILTGRYAPDELIDRADLVTEMREVKHPYQGGLPGREGIEF